MESSERKLPYLIGQLLCENLFSVISFCIIVMQNAGIVYYFWNILLSVENLLLKVSLYKLHEKLKCCLRRET